VEKKFIIQPAALTDFERYAEIYQACFQMNASREFFTWKYLENPYGPVTAFEAVDGDRVAAFYGLLPDKFVEEGRDLLAYQSMDTMTHPAYQRLGLFSRTAKATFQHVVDRDGSLLLFGIPGIRALPGFVKLGWKHAHNFSFLFQNSSLIRSRNSPGDFADLKVSFDGWNSYFASRRSFPGLRQRKLEQALLQWYVYRHPYRKFEVLGYARNGELRGFLVSREVGDKRRLIHWVDAKDPEEREQIACFLISALAKKYPRTWIYCWEPTESGLRNSFRQHWFIRNPLDRGPFSHRVPLILHHLGNKTKSPDWPHANRFDWQAMNQD